MSAITPSVPYVAPWQTQFNRYAVQFVAMPYDSGTNQIAVSVPAGQWWRPLYLFTDYVTSSASGSREVRLLIFVGSNQRALIGTPGAQSPSYTVQYIFGVGLTSFSTTDGVSNGTQSIAMPDLLWPQNTTFQIRGAITPTSDGFGDGTMAVEIYTEDYNNPGTLVPVATPTIG